MIKVAIGTCVALAALITVATRSASEGPTSVGEGDRVDEVTLPAEKSELATSKSGQLSAQPPSRPKTKKPAPTTAVAPATTGDLADPIVFRARQRELLEAEIKHESRDEAWAAQASEQIRDGLRNDDSIKDLEVDCRESLCRLSMTFRSDNPSSPDMGVIARSIPWPTTGFFDITLDGSSAMLYVTREGRTLPTI